MEKPTTEVEVVNTIQGVKSLADGIAVLNASHRNDLPLFYIDIDPQSLGANGELNLLTIMLYYGKEYRRRLFLVDVNHLANQAFSTRGYYGASLRSILDSASYRKIFFDVRQHSYILYSQYGVKLQGVHDLQLMENARRSTERKRKYLQTFEPLIQSVARGENRKRWLVDRFNGEWTYKNSAMVFQKRPVIAYIRLYCCRNIRVMPNLYDTIWRAVPLIMDLVAQESQRRIDETQEDGYDPSASGELRSPWTAEQNEELDCWVEMGLDLILGSSIA
ncbi:hypothetical protein H9Q69_005060 [Fusarium xylarioides]|uniref:3'-5' exonuclease domain-containing protein n=1 Tax=Fusarium xylarioides TaxID=221167 RepID=A0A9P7IA30_9HYPO|nr:hypothetical protein H9Q72_001624 [Fusarium xylarioides]KAG5795915.1 hypothetical protein H9Q69_005060 [Fusarium xylarioides]KAG5820392.1 hypothetical protein H9Q71_000608 [Fusarium xylarioides]KAG5829321.1 hypothetical protein H9Q74_000619 [Fusarium xylarioides]